MASDEYYDDYYDDDEGRTWPLRLAGLSVVALGVFAFVWFGLLSNDDNGTANQQLASADEASPSVDDVDSSTTDTDLDDSDDADAETGDDAESGEVDESLDDDQPVTTDDADADVDTAGVGDADAGEPPATAAIPIDAELDSAVPGAAPVEAPAPAPVEASYPTLPDGSPVPVLAIYDGELITLSGSVPTEEAAQRLQVLALANSTVPGAEVASFLTIEPSVPLGVGVRVIEMNSARFPEGSPSISPEHGTQLDRIVAVMSSLPHVTVNVIGHSDQRGDEGTNFELSADRARAAADYVAAGGIDPSRLSSRGAGESDLLTLNNDEAALALNRRTELVFFGLLVDPPAPAESTEST